MFSSNLQYVRLMFRITTCIPCIKWKKNAWQSNHRNKLLIRYTMGFFLKQAMYIWFRILKFCFSIMVIEKLVYSGVLLMVSRGESAFPISGLIYRCTYR